MMTQTTFALYFKVIELNGEIHFEHFLYVWQKLGEFAGKLLQKGVFGVNRW
jgi:hypothetical protein